MKFFPAQLWIDIINFTEGCIRYTHTEKYFRGLNQNLLNLQYIIIERFKIKFFFIPYNIKLRMMKYFVKRNQKIKGGGYGIF